MHSCFLIDITYDLSVDLQQLQIGVPSRVTLINVNETSPGRIIDNVTLNENQFFCVNTTAILKVCAASIYCVLPQAHVN